MNTALVSGLIILVLLIIMLIAGVPIAVALGVSSVCAILPIMDLNVAVLTGCQRIFSGISVFSLLAIPFFILAGNIMNKGGIAVQDALLEHLLRQTSLQICYSVLFPDLVQQQLLLWDLSSDQSRKKRDMTRTSQQQLTLQLHRQDF